MRTTIALDDELLAKAQAFTGLRETFPLSLFGAPKRVIYAGNWDALLYTTLRGVKMQLSNRSFEILPEL